MKSTKKKKSPEKGSEITKKKMSLTKWRRMTNEIDIERLSRFTYPKTIPSFVIFFFCSGDKPQKGRRTNERTDGRKTLEGSLTGM